MNQRPSKRARREAARRARVRRQRIRWLAMVTVVAIAVVGVVVLRGPDDAQAVAPDFELSTNDGEAVRLSDFRGRPVALTFMHTY